MRGKAWTKEEIRNLWNAVGSYSVAWIRRRTEQPYLYPNAPAQRSVMAVYKKTHRELGDGGLTRGSWTLARLGAYTGYNRSQIMRAQRALRQRWQRLGPRGWYLITQEQVEEIIGWLVHDYWSAKHRLYGCAWCTTERLKLKGSGLCVRCFWKHRRLCIRLGLPTRLAEQFEVVTRLRELATDAVEHGRFLERVGSRIAAGVALEPAELRELARTRNSVRSEGADAV